MLGTGKNICAMQSEPMTEKPRNKTNALSLASNHISDREVHARFTNAIEALSSLGSEEGVQLVPYEDPSLPSFNVLTPARQLELTIRVEQYCSVMKEVKHEERYVVRNSNSLWRMLGKMNLRSSPDLFENIEDDDVIEVYDLDGHQLYRSFNFFPICTYTLEQIYSIPWFDLYERNEEMIRANLESVNEVLSSPFQGTRATRIPAHEVRETNRPARRRTLIQPRFMSPVFDTKRKVAGFINTFRPLQSTLEPC